MTRAVLTAYLIALMLAGPALCCCNTSRAFATLAFKLAAKRPSHSTGCQCSRKAAETGNQASQQQPPCEECPCSAKQHHKLPLIVDSPSATTAKVLNGLWQQLTLASQLCSTLEVAPNAREVVAWESPGFPRLDGKGILRALHILRC